MSVIVCVIALRWFWAGNSISDGASKYEKIPVGQFLDHRLEKLNGTTKFV